MASCLPETVHTDLLRRDDLHVSANGLLFLRGHETRLFFLTCCEFIIPHHQYIYLSIHSIKTPLEVDVHKSASTFPSNTSHAWTTLICLQCYVSPFHYSSVHHHCSPNLILPSDMLSFSLALLHTIQLIFVITIQAFNIWSKLCFALLDIMLYLWLLYIHIYNFTVLIYIHNYCISYFTLFCFYIP